MAIAPRLTAEDEIEGYVTRLIGTSYTTGWFAAMAETSKDHKRESFRKHQDELVEKRKEHKQELKDLIIHLLSNAHEMGVDQVGGELIMHIENLQCETFDIDRLEL